MSIRELPSTKNTQREATPRTRKEIQGYVRLYHFEDLCKSFEQLRQTNQIRQEARKRPLSQQQVDCEKNLIPMYSGNR